MRRVLLSVCLLAVLAGCSTAEPTPTADPVQYNITNAETTDYTVVVGAVDGDVSSLGLTFANGTERAVGVPSPDAPGDPLSAVYAFENVTAVAVGGQSERLSVDLGAGESATGELELDGSETVVFTARSEGAVRAVALGRCAADRRPYLVDFIVGSYGPGIGLACQGD